MAGELTFALPGMTGATLRAVIRRVSDGSVWYTVTPAWEAWSDAHVASYAVTLTEQGTGSGRWLGNKPAGVTVPYSYEVCKLAGGSLAKTDPVVGTGDSIAETIGAAGAGLTALGDTRLANLDATVSSRGTSTYAGGAVASVTGAVNVGTVETVDATDAIQAAAAAALAAYNTTGVAKEASAQTLLARIIGTLAAGTHSPQSGDAYGRLTGTVEPLVSGVAAAVWAHATGIAVALAVTAVSIRAAVWDAVAASYNAALSMGAKINAAAGLTPQEVRDSLKLAPTAGAPAAGSTDADLDTLTAGVNVTTIGGQAATAAAPVAFPAAVGTSTYAGGAAEPGDAMTLTGAYDAAKSAASATELAAVQTHGDSAWATATAAGSVEYPYVVTDPNGDPVPDSLVWVTAHGSGLILASGYTDETGSVLFALDPGSYDFRVRKGGFNSVVDTETVA